MTTLHIHPDEYEKLRGHFQKDLLAMLRELEWVDDFDQGPYGGAFQRCPVCMKSKGSGHASDCRLKELIG